MTTIDVKLLVNRFDCDPETKGAEFSDNDTVAVIKERYFLEDIEKKFNIRIIHGGRTLRDDSVLSSLRGYTAGEQLVLMVFVTKPDTLPKQEPVAPKRFISNVASVVWVLVLMTLWYYKLKLGGSFRKLPLFVIYSVTFVGFHALFTRIVRGSRTE
uniref:Ubiquitin-like domain-containing protein n=1 Tax=Babesia bovis TaxID=5865 RepID=S6BNQ0_BABBO|nr:hypothetical protein [Babesia bovis]